VRIVQSVLYVLQCNSANLRVRTHLSYVERYYKAARELIPLGLVSFSSLVHLTYKVKGWNGKFVHEMS
jgi:hypothetical protein